MTGEAEKLERAGQLAEARAKYAESQALIEVKDVTDALKRLDEEIHKRVKDALNDSRKLYEKRKFKEAAAVLDVAMKLQAFQPVLAYNLALCYHQLGDRNQALEYLRKAKTGTADPKQKQQLLQLQTFFTTGENGFSVNDTDRDRINRVNILADSVDLEASLADEGGVEVALSEADSPPSETAPLRPATQVMLKTDRPAGPHSDVHGVTDRVCAMRCLSSKAPWRPAQPRPSISRIASSRMDEPARRSGCWRNIWRWPPALSTARRCMPASLT